MKILFAHHGSFSSNSMNHIGPFAAELKKLGHESAIALPELDPSFQFFPYPQIPAIGYEDVLENPYRFGGHPPDVVHAWTPREIVRQFCEGLCQRINPRLIIHLEDDECALARRKTAHMAVPLHEIDPVEGPWFLELADGFTLITDSLANQVPAGAFTHTLRPGFDKDAARNNPCPKLEKTVFGIPGNFRIITYPGASSGANADDLLDLYEAVHLLNEHGTPCILLKTGFPDVQLRSRLKEGEDRWIRDVGYLPREQVWRLIEMADVVVQPGRINDYNHHRLPSKLPDFLCLGKPLVTTSANLGQSLVDGEQALLLSNSSPQEIAARCQELFSNPQQAEKMAGAGRKAGLEWFNLSNNTLGLVKAYEQILHRKPNPMRAQAGDPVERAITRLKEELQPIEVPSGEAAKLSAYLKQVRNHKTVSRKKKTAEPPTALECQVYYPSEPTRLELGSIRRWYVQFRPQSWLIPFSPSKKLDWFRIDPGQYPGTYTIKSWSLLDANQLPIFEWTAASQPSVSCQLTGATIGPYTEDGLEIWSLTHDPQMLFAPLPALDVTRIAWLKLQLTANEIESPLATPLRLRRKTDQPSESPEKSVDWTDTIDTLLATYQRRRSPVLRFVDRFRKR